ncbi:GDP-L-fucose synthase [Gammaproteobacteria bacterium]|nr:GDP-L-fucose synthase [Gammaproteobacteria bacterium]
MNYKQKIFVAGSSGMVGSAIVRELKNQGFLNIITSSSSELDLVDQSAVRKFFEIHRPDQVYLAAAKVGGIHANNSFPANFIYDNIMIQANVINQSFNSGVKKLLFLGSSCVYPKLCSQPIKESELLSGHLEPTNEPYAIAKIAGIKLCESFNRQFRESHSIDYRSAMPTNLYGTGDNYHAKNSHVIPALIRKFHDAKINLEPLVLVWGSGRPLREFLFVDDLASALIMIMEEKRTTLDNLVSPMESHINIGYGTDITIKDLAFLIADVVGFSGRIEFDSSMPDGTPRKILDISKLNSIGWSPQYNLKQGLLITYNDFKNKLTDTRGL